MKTKVHYSKNNQSFTGANYASNCVTGSSWKISVNPDNGKIFETLLKVNTDIGKANFSECEEFVQNVRGW
jgi:hypothetical protein